MYTEFIHDPDPILEQYLTNVRNTPPLSKEEKATLPRLLKEKDPHATVRMVDAHLADVLDLISQYRARCEKARSMLIPELIQEGNSGLIYAVKRFDWDHPEDFPDHMRNCVELALDKAVQFAVSRRRTQPGADK